MGRSARPRWPWRWAPPRASAKKRDFQLGSEVEVRSKEEGFIGGWFEATVTRILYKQRRYRVSYNNIVADDAPDKPLTESVPSSLIRPRPPPDSTLPVFGLHRCVEAFHNEGWWPGVVSKLPDGGAANSRDQLYSVYFPASREQFQFKASELRRCLEWVKRKWVSVEESQEGAHVMFGEGTLVEVSRDKVNFGAAWFVGTVVKVIGRRFFLVEYQNIRVDSDCGTDMLLKEIVDLQYIRPCPPASMFTSFDVLDKVEGFNRDGWYAGVVSDILHGSRYSVKYKHQEDEMVLNHTSLRPVRVWVNDHWVDISRDCKVKTPAPGRTKPRGHRRKSSSGTISVSVAGTDDRVCEGSNFPRVKRKKEDGPRKKRMAESYPVSKKSKKVCLSLSVPVPTYKETDGETTNGSAVATFKRNGATGPIVKGGIKLCESGKKLKAGNLLEETVSISKRKKLHASEQSSLSSPVLTSHNNDSEVYDIIGVTNLKDRNVEEPILQDMSSQSRKKLEKGTNESVITGKESFCRLGEGPEHQANEANLVHLPVGRDAVDTVPIADWISGKGNSSPTKITTTRRRKLTIRPPKKLGKTPEVDDLMHHAHDVVEEHSGCITPEAQITFMTSNESKQMKEGTEQVVGGEGWIDLVKVSNQMPTFDVPYHHDIALESQNYLPPISKENSPCNDEALSDNQSHIMVDACVTLIESSILNATSAKHSVVQQPSTMKSLPIRSEDIWSCASRVAADEAEGPPEALPPTDRAHDHNEVILGGSMSHKAAEMENASIAPMPSGTLSYKENNICGQQEISPRRLLHEGPVVEEQALCDATPCGSVPSSEDTHVHDEPIPNVFPSGISSSFVSRRGEIQNSSMDPSENGRNRESQALLAGLQENVSPESNHDSTGPQSDGAVFNSSEPLAGGSSSEKLVLSFTKRSEFWGLLESKEVFRSLPQQPHFHPLHQYDQELREGMAIGLMVTFANLVGDITSLRIVDPQHDFEVKMKVLRHLESYGFNVLSVRTSLERLLQLRGWLIKLEVKKLSLEAKFTVSEEEEQQNCWLSFLIEQAMLELEQKLAHLEKKKTYMLHELHTSESEIAILKRRIQENEEARASVIREFSSVLTAPW